MEVRYRQPSPANVPMNEGFASREHARHHFKTPYPYSRYYVRNFWDPVKEGGVRSTVFYAPDISSFSPSQEAFFLNFIKGDDLGNQTKKEKYIKAAKEILAKNNKNEWTEETPKKFAQDIRVLFNDLSESRREKVELDAWDDAGSFPNESPYYANPDTYLHEFNLHHWSSYELQLYLELEKWIEDYRDEIEEEGEDFVEGNSDNWKVLDDQHRTDQKLEVVKNLKQRNVRNIR